MVHHGRGCEGLFTPLCLINKNTLFLACFVQSNIKHCKKVSVSTMMSKTYPQHPTPLLTSCLSKVGNIERAKKQRQEGFYPQHLLRSHQSQRSRCFYSSSKRDRGTRFFCSPSSSPLGLLASLESGVPSMLARLGLGLKT